MAGLDVLHLDPKQLVMLLNSTPAGAVVTAPGLRRQMNRAGYRIGDGASVNLVRYIAWLLEEVDAQADVADHRDADLQRKRIQTRKAQDISPIPEVADPARRKTAGKSLRKFCETYFAEVFWRPWSKDHLKAIKTLERVIRHGGLFAFAMPRGKGKTSLARAAAFWAVLYGHRLYLCLIGGSEKKSLELLEPMKMAVLENRALREDFPESLYPLYCLQNTAKLQAQQHCQGKFTHVRWQPDRIVFPSLPDAEVERVLAPLGLKASPSAGSVISVTSLDAHMRGQQFTRPDGRVIRPSLVLLDDPQTRASARSPGQTKLRIDLLFGDVLPMAGPGERMSAMLTCTKIYEGDLADQMLDAEKHPEWQGLCTKMVYAFPTNEKLWAQYAEIRADGLRRGKDLAPATAFYRKHRKAMDRGASVSWKERYERETEASAIQHAMNLKLTNSDTFFSEYQNEPVQEQVADDVLLPKTVAEKVNGRQRGTVPLACCHVAGFVDVHDKILFWTVAAFDEKFGGCVVDYGTYPSQGKAWFEMRSARRTLRQKYPGRGADAAILAGLERTTSDLLGREWPRTGGGIVRLGRLLIDMRYKPELVGAVKHKVGGEAMVLSVGIGVGARNRPMSQYKHKPGEKYGHHWYMPSVRGTREFQHVAVDVNYWKSFVHTALATPAGDPGSMTLFGKKPEEHELFSEHVAGAEYWVETTGYGRTIHEWKERPSKPDNHWFDCLVGCAAGASMLGAKTAGMEGTGGNARKRYSQQDLRRGR